MKKNLAITAVGSLLTAVTLPAAVIQTIDGPAVATTGVDNVLVTTADDTDNWIDTLNAGGTTYFGWDWTIDNNAGETGAGGFFGGLQFDSTGGDGQSNFILGNGWFDLDYGGGTGGTVAGSTGQLYVVGETVRLVASVTIDVATGLDSWQLWVDPAVTDGAFPATQVTNINLGTITQLRHRAGNGTGQTTLENLVVADDFQNAVLPVPEPSSVILLGMSALLLGKRRR